MSFSAKPQIRLVSHILQIEPFTNCVSKQFTSINSLSQTNFKIKQLYDSRSKITIQKARESHLVGFERLSLVSLSFHGKKLNLRLPDMHFLLQFYLIILPIFWVVLILLTIFYLSYALWTKVKIYLNSLNVSNLNEEGLDHLDHLDAIEQQVNYQDKYKFQCTTRVANRQFNRPFEFGETVD